MIILAFLLAADAAVSSGRIDIDNRSINSSSGPMRLSRVGSGPSASPDLRLFSGRLLKSDRKSKMAAGPVNKRLSSDACKNQIHRGRLVSGILLSLSLSLLDSISLSFSLYLSLSLTSLFSSSSTAILPLSPLTPYSP